MKLLRRLAAWVWRPSAGNAEAVRAEIEAALQRRRERRPALQARARKGVATRNRNRMAADRLAGTTPEERTH